MPRGHLGGHLTIGQQETRRPRRWRLALAVACVASAAVIGGFAWFVRSVQHVETAITQRADGLVVLTGGPERIADAVDLLATGHGKRLLITGVHPTTRMEELSRRVPRHANVFSCCVDLDRSATNTIGNAVETRRWAVDRGFRSLIVVTSSYHMPRAMAELTHQLPELTLIPYPVVTERQRSEPWWSDATTTRTFAIEYIKYIAALVRMRFEPQPNDARIAAAQPDAHH